MSGYRNVITLILAICLMQAAASFLGVITPVGLTELKAGETLTGLIGSVYSAGFMAGAWAGPALLGRYGTIRLYATAAAITAVCALAMGMLPGIAAWGASRVIQGIGLGLLFASAESWLGQAVPKDRRGDIIGFYDFLSPIAGLLAPSPGVRAFGARSARPQLGVDPALPVTCHLVPDPAGGTCAACPRGHAPARSFPARCVGRDRVFPRRSAEYGHSGPAANLDPHIRRRRRLAPCWYNGRPGGFPTGWSGASWSPACRSSRARRRWCWRPGARISVNRLCSPCFASGARGRSRSTAFARPMRLTAPDQAGFRK